MREERFTSAKKGNKREYFINGAKMTMAEEASVFFLEETLCAVYEVQITRT